MNLLILADKFSGFGVFCFLLNRWTFLLWCGAFLWYKYALFTGFNMTNVFYGIGNLKSHLKFKCLWGVVCFLEIVLFIRLNIMNIVLCASIFEVELNIVRWGPYWCHAHYFEVNIFCIFTKFMLNLYPYGKNICQWCWGTVTLL